MRHARTPKFQLSGPTVHSYTAAVHYIVSCRKIYVFLGGVGSFKFNKMKQISVYLDAWAPMACPQEVSAMSPGP